MVIPRILFRNGWKSTDNPDRPKGRGLLTGRGDSTSVSSGKVDFEQVVQTKIKESLQNFKANASPVQQRNLRFL